MSKTEILTTTLPTGETVLAKKDSTTAEGRYYYPCLTPLRYGNETQARKKLDSILPLLSPSRSAGIVKQEGRFLIFIYDNPGYQTISRNEVERMMLSPHLASMAPSIRKRYVFATISGQRMNPRNRHNHPQNTTDERYYYV